MLRQLVRRLVVAGLHACLRRRASPLPEAFGANGLLIVAPHPDDETLGCGRLIASSRRRDIRVHLVWLTDGEASHADYPGGASSLAKARRAEACAAAQILGVPESCLHFVGAPDGQLPHLSAEARAAIVAKLTELIDSIQPSAVLVTSGWDGSTEHSAAHAFAVEAVAVSSQQPDLVTYLVWAHWQVRGLVSIFRNSLPLYFGRCDQAAENCRSRAILAHASQLIPQPPSGKTSLSAEFLACLPRRGEFFLKG